MALFQGAIGPRALEGCRIHRALDVLRRSPRCVAPSCWRQCADYPGVWGDRSRYGPCCAWSITERNKQAFGPRMRPCGSLETAGHRAQPFPAQNQQSGPGIMGQKKTGSCVATVLDVV
jgi:hypothetical protein